VRDMKRFENIDYFVDAFNIQPQSVVQSILSQLTHDDIGTRPKDEEEEEIGLEFFGGGTGLPEEALPVEENTAVRDWLLRRHMTLHTKEVNERLKNKEEIVVYDPFAKPEEDVSDPFYPGGHLGNPNTEPPEDPEIVYDPEEEERSAEESQEQDLGDPSGEHAAEYGCYVPGTNQQTQYVEYDDQDPPVAIPSTRRPHTEAECAELPAEWRQIPRDLNPDESEEDPWGHPDPPPGNP